ncbi:FCD domain-containing protein [Aquabacter cavernae]|uniref:FCD domain-containing protein n=1 Tax=Aquabacter cavernae TaxID=2496029 RepID=UPI000F8E6004|nr:FCD domain-containing protein [Aquabacter cavernae]
MADKQKQPGETRAADVLHRMRLDIINCELQPGEKLRFEALRARYTVSFSTLREALSRLAAESLVVAEGQRGFMVAPVSIEDLNDLTDTRVLIENEMLRRSMRYGDDDWEANILASFHRMDKMQKRLGREYYLSEEWAAVHSAFHASLVSECRSPTLIELRDKLFERAQRYRRMSSQFRKKWRKKDVEHKMIVDAALARDEDLALRLIERHIRETSENVIAHAQHLFPQETPHAFSANPQAAE